MAKKAFLKEALVIKYNVAFLDFNDIPTSSVASLSHCHQRAKIIPLLSLSENICHF
jgi:hypothetical protein